MKRERLVALRLALLAREDRDWLLGRLPEDLRQRVTHELPTAFALRDVDAAQCEAWARRLGESRSLVEAPADAGVSVDLIDRIDCAPPDTVASVLRSLPSALQVDLLRTHAWRWKLGYLEQLAEGERERVAARLEHGAELRPAAHAALLRLFADRLSVAPAGPVFDTWLAGAA